MAETDVQGMLVRIEATTSQMQKELSTGEAAVERTSKNMDGSLARVDTAFDRAGASARGMQGVISSVISTFGGFNIAAAGSVAGLVALTQSTISHAQEIKNLSSVANTSVEDFQRMAFGAKSVGVEQDKLGDILKDVNDRVGEFLQRGGGEMSDFFKEIAPRVGVTAEQFRNLSGPQALQLYYDSLQKAGLNQQQLTTYMEQMADEATALIPLLRDNGRGFKDAGDQAQRLGAVLNQVDIERLAASGQAMRDLEAIFGGLGQSIALGVLPGIESLNDRLAALRDNGAAEKVGQTIAFLAQNVDVLVAAVGGKLTAAFAKYAIEAVRSTWAVGEELVSSTAKIKTAALAKVADTEATLANAAAKAREATATAAATQATAAEAAAKVASLAAGRESLAYQAALAAGTKEEAQLKASLAAVETELATARKAATAAATAEATASNAVAAATARETVAVEANSAAQKEAAAVKGLLSRAATGLLGLLGGPVGLAALAIGAGVAYLTMRSSAETATKALIEQNLTLEETIKKFQSLSAEQQRFQKIQWAKDQKAAAEEAANALFQFSRTGTEALSKYGYETNQYREQFLGMVQEVRDGKRTLDSVTDWAKKNTEITDDQVAKLSESASAYSTSSETVEALGDRLNQASSATGAMAKSTKALSEAQAGSQGQTQAQLGEWEKYIAKLTETRDLLGANQEAEAKYQAAKMGLTAEQTKQAEIVASQIDVLKKYQEAIKENDKVEQAALKAQLIALYTQEQAAEDAAAAVKKSHEDAAAAAKASADEQIDQMQRVIDKAVNLTKGRNLLLLPEQPKQDLSGYGLLTNGGTPAAPAVTATPRKTPEQLANEHIAQLNETTEASTKADKAANAAATALKNQAKALADLTAEADIAIRSATGLADAYLAGTDKSREFTLQQKVEEALLKTGAGARQNVIKAITEQMAAEDRLAVSKQAYSLQQEAADQIDLAKATLQGADALAEYNVQKALKVALAGKDIAQASVEYEALVKATRAQQDALDIARKATAAGSILDRLYPEQKLLREYTEEQNALNAAMQLNQGEAGKYQEALGRLELEYQRNQAAATTWGQVTIAAVDRIDDAFADMWKSVLSKSGNFMDSLKNSFRQFLAEMLHLAITKPIIVQIGSALGVGGLAGSAAGGGGDGLSVSSLRNAASSAYRLGTSGFGSALSAGWSAGEGFLGGLQGAISSGSSYISSALASLFGGTASTTAYQSAIATGASQFGAQFSMQAGAQASWSAASGAAASGTGAAASGGLSLGGLASAALPAAAAFAAFKAYEAYKNGVRLDASDTRGNAAAWATGFQPIAELNGAIGKLTDKLGIGGALGNLLNIPGTITAMIGSALFGGKWQTKDTGISLGVNDGDFLGQQFVYQKKKGGLFGKNKKRTRYSALDPEVESALQDTYDTTQDSVVELLDRIGVSVGEGAFAGLQIARQQISTKGKTSEQIQEEISKIFSGFADQMVAFIDQGAGGFGYSYEELAKRVNVFESFNKSLGLVDMAMLKLSPHSMELANALVTAAGGMEAYTESLNTYFEAFFSESERADKTLSAVQEQFKAMNVALPETREGYRKVVEALDLTTETGQQMYLTLVGAAGAAAQAYDILESRAAAVAQAYSESLGAYLDAFFTDAERAESALAAVQQQFKAMNVALPETREGYRKVVEALDLTTATGQQMYRTLIGAAGSAAQAYDVLEARAAASAQAAQEEAARVAALLGSNVTAAMGAVQRAVNAQKTALTEAFNAQTASLNDMSQTAQQTVSDLTSVSNSLGNALKSLRGDSADAVKMLRSQAQATLASALAAARAGKSLSSIPGLEDALEVASQNSTAAYASLEAFNRDQGRTANVVSQLNAANGKQLTAAEKTVESLQAQIAQAQKSYDLQMAQYDAQLSLAQAQVDALNGVDNSIVSVATAVDRMSQAITASLSIKDDNAARQNTYDNNAALVRAVYRTVLGREAEAAGLASWTGALSGGALSYDDLMASIARQGRINGENVLVPGFASGGMFSGGLRLVGERGPELEVTGPSRIYNAGQTAAMLTGGQGEATAAEVRELRAELKSALFAIAKYTQKAAKNTDLLPQKLEQELYP